MIKYHYEIEQNTPEWHAMRRGVLTASNIGKVLTPAKLEMSKATGYLYDFCRESLDDMPYGQFSTRHTDRGHLEEEIALKIYDEKFGSVKKCGFVENTKYGFKIGCSPDGLIGDDEFVQVKSFTPNVQFGNIVDDAIGDADDLQVQFEMLVMERDKCKLIYQSSGTHQVIHNVVPNQEKRDKIISACGLFYERVESVLSKYRERIKDETRYTPTAYIKGLYDQPEEVF